METTFEKRGYLLEDFRLFHLKDAQGTKIGYHYHTFCKLLLLKSGSGSYSVDGQRYHLREGDVVLIGSNCVHRPEFEKGVAYERVIIYIDPTFLQRQSVSDCQLETVFSGCWGNVLRPEEPMRRKLFTLSEQLEKELNGDEYGRVILSNGLLTRLLVEIGRCLQSGQGQQVEKQMSGRVVEIRQYIEAHLEEDLSIDELAERFFVSKYHMMRQFREQTGQSIHNYLTERRLLHARELISSGMRATESCFRSGFRSYSSFTRAYGKRFGITPTGRKDTSGRRDETYE